MSGAPSLADVVSRRIRDALADLHTCQPGKVVLYNPALQTVDVQLQLRRTLYAYDGEPVYEEPPVLYNVPVAWPRGGGGFFVSFPLEPGDFVLVIFAESPTLVWRGKGDVSNPGLAERHSLNGAFALPCGYPDKKKLGVTDASSTDCVVGFEGGAKLKIDKLGGVTVEATSINLGGTATQYVAMANKVLTELTNLWKALECHTHPVAGATAGPATAVGPNAVPAANWWSGATNQSSPGSVAASKAKVE